jgi:hypothetical protein
MVNNLPILSCEKLKGELALADSNIDVSALFTFVIVAEFEDHNVSIMASIH